MAKNKFVSETLIYGPFNLLRKKLDCRQNESFFMRERHSSSTGEKIDGWGLIIFDLCIDFVFIWI